MKNVSRSGVWQAVGYRPHERQREFHDTKARFKVIVAGRRWGKSLSSAAEALPHLFTVHSDGTGKMFWIVAPDYRLGSKEFRYLYHWVRLLEHRWGFGAKKALNLRTGEMFIEMPWGTRIEVRSGERPDSLVGEGLAGVIMAEAAKIPAELWDKNIRPALADHKGWAIFSTTPEGFNWFGDIYQAAGGELDTEGVQPEPRSSEFGEWRAFRYPAWTNPVVYQGGFDDPEVLTQMRVPGGDSYFWQEIGAEFRSFAGQMYDFSPERHVQPWVYDPALPNYGGFDAGFTHPAVLIEAQIQWRIRKALRPKPDSRLIEQAARARAEMAERGYPAHPSAYADAMEPLTALAQPLDEDVALPFIRVWREFYAEQTPIHRFVELHRARVHPHGYRIDAIWGDPASPESAETFSQSLCPASTSPETRDWRTGVKLIGALLDPIDTIDGAPRLTIDPACEQLVKQMGTYRRKTPKPGAIHQPDEPLKKHDDGPDALRYFVHNALELGGVSQPGSWDTIGEGSTPLSGTERVAEPEYDDLDDLDTTDDERGSFVLGARSRHSGSLFTRVGEF